MSASSPVATLSFTNRVLSPLLLPSRFFGSIVPSLVRAAGASEEMFNPFALHILWLRVSSLGNQLLRGNVVGKGAQMARRAVRFSFFLPPTQHTQQKSNGPITAAESAPGSISPASPARWPARTLAQGIVM